MNRSSFISFMDAEKGYDSMNREEVWKVLEKYEIKVSLHGVRSLNEGYGTYGRA